MSFTSYKLNLDSFQLNNIQINSNEKNLVLKNIEELFVLEYLNEQEFNGGVNKIGERLRKNNKLKLIFNNQELNFVKMTGNKMSFMQLFINSIINSTSNEVNFIILENNFGIKSKIVDNTFVKISNIEDQLNDFFKNFKILKKLDIYFHELYKFDGYNFNIRKTYSTINKKSI